MARKYQGRHHRPEPVSDPTGPAVNQPDDEAWRRMRKRIVDGVLVVWIPYMLVSLILVVTSGAALPSQWIWGVPVATAIALRDRKKRGSE